MKNLLGDLQLDEDKGKTYALLYYATAIVHFIYYVIFSIEKCHTLAKINICLVIFYIVVGFIARNAKHFGGIFTACSIAMAIFLVSHYVSLGPSFGFQYVSIGMIPFMYYLAYVNGGGVEISKKGSIASFIVLCVVSMACSNLKYPLKGAEASEISRRIVTLLNLSLTFYISIRFMTEFVKKTYSDVGILENRNSDIEKSANVDALTGLLNRRSIEASINKAIFLARGEGQNFSVLMCDIDNFKHVNDTYGHDCGDQVLKNIASVIKGEVRPEDLVFRWGGEEILIIVKGGEYIAKAVAERCRKSIEDSSVNYNDREVKVTVTIGGATYYQGVTRDDLVNKADKNLYEGKQNGKNQVVM